VPAGAVDASRTSGPFSSAKAVREKERFAEEYSRLGRSSTASLFRRTTVVAHHHSNRSRRQSSHLHQFADLSFLIPVATAQGVDEDPSDGTANFWGLRPLFHLNWISSPCTHTRTRARGGGGQLRSLRSFFFFFFAHSSTLCLSLSRAHTYTHTLSLSLSLSLSATRAATKLFLFYIDGSFKLSPDATSNSALGNGFLSLISVHIGPNCA